MQAANKAAICQASWLLKARASLESARASMRSAEAAVKQSEAAADQAKANLDYCTIISPVNGIVIDRKVEEGETVVSSMNAVPVLTIAEDLETVWIEATVPEADIGAIREGQDVTFTADAYRERFKGRVRQIRRAASTVNNVVTFPVIVEAENPGEKLFPGMTVTLSVKTASASGAVAAPAAAFRFRPKEDDRARASGEDEPGPKIWLVNADGTLEARRVSEGVSDDTLTQLVCADADGLVGRDVAVGYQTATRAGGDATTNPFMPKPPQRGTKGTAPEPKTKKTP
jgi:HlyD family secretion protein